MDSRQLRRHLLFVISRIYEYDNTGGDNGTCARGRRCVCVCVANGMNGGSIRSDNATTRLPNNEHNKIA